MKAVIQIGKGLGTLFYYSSLPIAFITPDIRSTNAMLGIFVGAYIGKRVAGVAMMLAKKNEKDQEAAYGEEKSGLSSIFNKENYGTAIKYLLAGTAIATAGYIGTNTYHDVQEGRAPAWALLGNTFDTAYRPASAILSASADFGQSITGNLNPLPEEYKNMPLLYAYGRTIDGYVQCVDKAIKNDNSGLSGSCHGKVRETVNPVFDRN